MTGENSAAAAGPLQQEEDGPIYEWADGINDDDFPDKFGPPIIHTAFKRGRTVFRIGDTVQINTNEPRKWVACIIGFHTDYKFTRQPKTDPDRSAYRVELLYFNRQSDLNRYKKDGAEDVSFPAEICLIFRARYTSVKSAIMNLFLLFTSMRRYSRQERNTTIIDLNGNGRL
jgi:hypothetical protein